MSKQIEQKWTVVHPLFKCDVCGEEIGREQKGYVQVDQKLVYDVEVRRRIFQDNRESRALKLQGSVPPLDLFNLSEPEQAAGKPFTPIATTCLMRLTTFIPKTFKPLKKFCKQTCTSLTKIGLNTLTGLISCKGS